MVQVQQFSTGISYSIEILQQCGKWVKTKSQNFLHVIKKILQLKYLNVAIYVTFSLNDIHEPKSGKAVVKTKVFGKPDAITQVRSFEKM